MRLWLSRLRRANFLKDYRALLMVSLPLAVSALGEVVIGAVDTALLGRYQLEALAAVGIGGQLFFSLVFLIVVSATGQAVLSAQSYGAGRPRNVGNVLWHSLVLFGGASIVGIVVLFFGAQGLVGLFSDDKLVLQGAEDYLVWRSYGAPILVAYFLLLNVFAANKKTYWALVGVVIINVVNVIISFPLIYGFWGLPELGVLGSAIGGLVADSVGLLVLVVAFFVGRYHITIRPTTFKPQARTLRALGRLSWPTFVSIIFLQTAGFLILFVIGNLGTEQLATGQIIYHYVEAVVVVMYGLAEGGLILIGRAIGAGSWERAKELYHRNVEVLVMVYLVPMVIFLIYPEWMIYLFTDIDAILEIGVEPARVGVVGGLIISLALGNVAFLRGVGKPRADMIANVISVSVVHIPLIYLFGVVLDLGLTGLLWAELVFWVSRWVITQKYVFDLFSGRSKVVREDL